MKNSIKRVFYRMLSQILLAVAIFLFVFFLLIGFWLGALWSLGFIAIFIVLRVEGVDN